MISIAPQLNFKKLSLTYTQFKKLSYTCFIIRNPLRLCVFSFRGCLFYRKSTYVSSDNCDLWLRI